MSSTFTQAVEALTAQAQSLIAATTGEVDALREELEQERRFRRHLETAAATRAHEVAAQLEEARLERERLTAELAEALEGRRRAEAEVERFHEAIRQQLAIAEAEQAALEEAERERDRRREEAVAQRLQEAAEAAAAREAELQEAAERQRLALVEQLEQAQRARQKLERRLSGVRQAMLDLFDPQDGEPDGSDPAEDWVAADPDAGAEPEGGQARLSLRKILVARPAGQAPQPVLT
jgi:chromosome segregation ATPase